LWGAQPDVGPAVVDGNTDNGKKAEKQSELKATQQRAESHSQDGWEIPLTLVPQSGQ
jgi:hypothetical protein